MSYTRNVAVHNHKFLVFLHHLVLPVLHMCHAWSPAPFLFRHVVANKSYPRVHKGLCFFNFHVDMWWLTTHAQKHRPKTHSLTRSFGQKPASSLRHVTEENQHSPMLFLCHAHVELKVANVCRNIKGGKTTWDNPWNWLEGNSSFSPKTY